jgi:hypothetical protein
LFLAWEFCQSLKRLRRHEQAEEGSERSIPGQND